MKTKKVKGKGWGDGKKKNVREGGGPVWKAGVEKTRGVRWMERHREHRGTLAVAGEKAVGKANWLHPLQCDIYGLLPPLYRQDSKEKDLTDLPLNSAEGKDPAKTGKSLEGKRACGWTFAPLE